MGRYFSKFIIKSLFVVALLEPAYALPTCPKNLPMDKWTNCHGAIGDYVGGFKNGQPFGQGKVYMGDGILYATFENNGVNGNFTFTHPDCEIKGVARTDGEIGNPDSTVYAKGEMNCRDGLRYIGEFVNMWPQGKGTIFGVNGDIYVGKVKELIPHGWGKLTAKNGTVQEGMWNNGKFSEVTKLQISFNNLPKVKRRQLQSILKKLNYYKYSIDGLYGKGTETALKEYNKSFLTSNPLDQEKNIQKLFAAINNHLEIKEENPVKNQRDDEQNLCDKDPTQCSQVLLCESATAYIAGDKAWTTVPKYFTHVEQAKRRGLKCGIKDEAVLSSNQKICDEDPSHCSAVELCEKATQTKNNKLVWSTNRIAEPYTVAAKSVGLTCNIEGTLFKVASGSGFLISPAGHVVTAANVIHGCTENKIHTNLGEFSSTIIAKDTNANLAVLMSKRAWPNFFKLSKNDPYILQNVIAAGYPFKANKSGAVDLRTGRVSLTEANLLTSLSNSGNNTSIVKLDSSLTNGHVGAPLLDESGNVVGLVTVKETTDGQSSSFGITASAIKSFLIDNNISFQVGSDQKISNIELTEMANSSSIFISCWMDAKNYYSEKNNKKMFQNINVLTPQ